MCDGPQACQLAVLELCTAVGGEGHMLRSSGYFERLQLVIKVVGEPKEDISS